MCHGSPRPGWPREDTLVGLPREDTLVSWPREGAHAGCDPTFESLRGGGIRRQSNPGIVFA